MTVALACTSSIVGSSASSSARHVQRVPTVNCHDILILTRGNQTAVDLERGLCASRHRDRVHRARSVEAALKVVAERRITAAFLGCDLPDAIFRRIQQAGLDRPVRIVGIREGGETLRAIGLMSRQLIAAYVSLPTTLASLEALVRQPRPFPCMTCAPMRGAVA